MIEETAFMGMLADGRWADAILYCRDPSERDGWSGWHLGRLYEAALVSSTDPSPKPYLLRTLEEVGAQPLGEYRVLMVAERSPQWVPAQRCPDRAWVLHINDRASQVTDGYMAGMWVQAIFPPRPAAMVAEIKRTAQEG